MTVPEMRVAMSSAWPQHVYEVQLGGRAAATLSAMCTTAWETGERSTATRMTDSTGVSPFVELTMASSVARVVNLLYAGLRRMSVQNACRSNAM